MQKYMINLLLLPLAVLLAAPVFAQDTAKQQAEQGMPPIGPPEEIKEMAFCAGDWNVTGKYKMEPDSGWVDYSAAAGFKMIAGGSAVQMDYTGEFMGMPFIGVGINTYDREEKQWQQVWVDNFGARISYYTGRKVGNTYVYEGEDKYQGETMYGRIIISDIQDGSFEWKMDMSPDKQEWWTSMTATYTKK